MRSGWILFYRHLEMTSPLEQLPVELLEPMIASNPVRARLVSRTLRQVSERPFRQLQQLCRQPIMTQEIEMYLQSRPVFVGFPQLDTVIDNLDKINILPFEMDIDRVNHIATINFYGPSVHNPSEYQIVRRIVLTQHKTSFQIEDLFESRYFVTIKDIISWKSYLEFDVYTQWQILTHRDNCRDMTRMMAGLFTTKLNQLRDRVITLSNQWFRSNWSKEKMMAIGLLFYFQTYLKINTNRLLRIYNTPPQAYIPTHLYKINRLLNPQSSQSEYQQLLTTTDNVYDILISTIESISTQ
jgi:hypothetical protein